MVNFKLLKRYSDANRRTPSYSRSLKSWVEIQFTLSNILHPEIVLWPTVKNMPISAHSMEQLHCPLSEVSLLLVIICVYLLTVLQYTINYLKVISNDYCIFSLHYAYINLR